VVRSVLGRFYARAHNRAPRLRKWCAWRCACLGWAALLSPVQADSRLDPGSELELIESTERSEDPLGLDESTGSELEQAARRLPKPETRAILPSPYVGEGLSSIEGVREQTHTCHVTLEQGLAFVRLELTFSSRAKHAAELGYRLPLPKSAVVTRVRSCAQQSCRDAQPADANERTGGALALYAEAIEDARGRALALRVGAIEPGGTLSLRVDYVAEAPVRGGRARFRVPPRGYDPNLATTALHFEAPTMAELTPSAQQESDAWSALELSAKVTPRTAASQLVRARCGAAACSRRFEVAPTRAAQARATWLFIDASPSMEGPARGRVGSVIGALLTALPESTPMRAYAFGARAIELGRFRAGEAPLMQLADAPLLELEAATHPSAAVRLTRPEIAREKPRIVMLSDGLFDPTLAERDALRNARKLGAELWLLALGESEPRLAGEFTHVVRLAELVDAARTREQLVALEEAVAVVAQPALASGLYPGEQRVRETRPNARYALAADAHWLAFWFSREQAAPVWRSGDFAQLPARPIAAVPFRARERPPATSATGMPKESVLSMLRTQLVPQARACLRADRKGRGDYAVELTFHALFAQREVLEARVEGAITRELKGCLEALLPKLRVPAFSGALRVHYPIHTEREAPAPVIELEPELHQQLDRAFGGPRALP
jgi:hypothetical protein